MNAKEKMMAIIKDKKSGNKNKKDSVAKNDGKFMRKAPIFHK